VLSRVSLLVAQDIYCTSPRIRHSFTSILVVTYLPFRLLIYYYNNITMCNLLITCYVCTYARMHCLTVMFLSIAASTMKFTFFLIFPRNILVLLCLRSAYYRSAIFFMTTNMLFIIFTIYILLCIEDYRSGIHHIRSYFT
jgi:hypothetical protein